MSRQDAIRGIYAQIEHYNQTIARLKAEIPTCECESKKQLLEHLITMYKITTMILKTVNITFEEYIPLNVDYVNRLRFRRNDIMTDMMEIMSKGKEGDYLFICKQFKSSNEKLEILINETKKRF
jgi:hypothetical protein